MKVSGCGWSYSVDLYCLCLQLIFLSEWLIFSVMASDNCSNAKVILSLIFEFPVKSM